MAIKFINYTKEQKQGMAVSGYSLYVNGNHCCIHETLTSVNHELKRYPQYNDIEIYPVLKRRFI
jgi:hypothetical protein